MVGLDDGEGRGNTEKIEKGSSARGLDGIGNLKMIGLLLKKL